MRALPLSLLLLSAMPLPAQVEQVSIRTTGISCGVCAAVSEIHLKRMAGVERVAISRANESIIISYRPGAAFSPRRIREVLHELEVGVTQFQIRVRGCFREQGGKQFFIAAKEAYAFRFAGADPIPRDTPVLIEAILDDRPDPMELKILNLKRVSQ
ncbi:MAG TPA: hypothetical protein VL285_02345 [Bryobacteraceae bacterium]|jgi:copper chaperone CopZ|nr:hypothetical protein [Bryobacteraceae bacterium]